MISGTKLILASHFGEYKLGAEIIEDTFDKRSQQVPGVGIMVVWISLEGLCCYAESYNKSPNRAKHLKMAHRCRKQIKAWEKQGNPNCSHFCALLTAEKYALIGRHQLAAANYKKAIELAGSSGFVHDQAIASERFTGFLLRSEMKDEARHHFNESIRLYTKWGAGKKVGLLQVKADELWH